MSSNETAVKLTPQQQRILKLLYKFRFVSAQSLADVMGIRRESTYEVLEFLVKKQLVVKVYKKEFRIDRKPAYYYLSKPGVTTVRKLLDVKEAVVHTLYKNDQATDDFIDHCLTVLKCYAALIRTLPPGTKIFAKAELNQFKEFPKNRPDLYIRTPEGQEAMVVIVEDKPAYIVRKRLDEIIAHSEDEGWSENDYPRICFILKDTHSKNSFLYGTRKKLDGMGFDEQEIYILAADLKSIQSDWTRIWANAFNPLKSMALFE